jgi:hypothetical protein
MTTAQDILAAARIDVEGTPGERLATATLDNAAEYLESGRVSRSSGTSWVSEPHASDCAIWVDEPCDCVTGKEIL